MPLVGVLISIGTAYSLFYFSNILEFFQALGMFFLLPLFGVIILGMMWKRCSPAGAFWGFLLAIIASIGMFFFVHSFPGGYRPRPQVTLDKTSVNGVEVPVVVRLEKKTDRGEKKGEDAEKRTAGKVEQIVKVIVESGQVTVTNVPISVEAGKPPFVDGEMTIGKNPVELPQSVLDRQGQTIIAEPDVHDPSLKVRVLAPEVVLAGSKQTSEFGEEGLPVVLQPGVKVVAHDVVHYVDSKFNRDHDKYLARSEKAKPIAVYIYCSFWTFLLSVAIAVGVSLFTPPKPKEELKDLVMGLTKIPDQGPCPWYQRPALWAVVVLIVLATLNLVFW